MIDKNILIAGLAEKASALINNHKSQTREDLEKNMKALFTQMLSRLDLVSREEFDTQVAVLHQTRQKIESLQNELKAFKNKKDQ
ncbi:hypothetical protein CI610_01936 [invertebrate metagenome]|uniref:Ubiquinone biosynthesis accessory factor UbiK n=1 Tax=invertebrate metagenome TaxID=1711999 RepID=A0A2H9T7A3_9ZZZZ